MHRRFLFVSLVFLCGVGVKLRRREENETPTTKGTSHMQMSSYVFCNLMAGRSEATLEQLYQAARECGVDPSEITLGDLLGQPPQRVTKPSSSSSRPSKPVAVKAATSNPLDVRKPSGRAMLDAIVLSSLARETEWKTVESLDVYGDKGPETVTGLRSPIPSKQLRESLRRLVKGKVIERRGQARGTQYRLANGVVQRKKIETMGAAGYLRWLSS